MRLSMSRLFPRPPVRAFAAAFVLTATAATCRAFPDPTKTAPSLYSAPGEVYGASGKPVAPLLVDVRDAEDYAAFRIHGSINVPLFALKTKTFPSDEALVLIDRGDDPSSLEKEYAFLRSKGWRVSILNGGLARWKSDGFPLEGFSGPFPKKRSPLRLETPILGGRTQRTSHSGKEAQGCPACR